MKITIFGKPGCRYCTSAKKLAKQLEYSCNAEVSNIETTKEEVLKALELVGIGSFNTYPQIIIDGQHIGGFTEFDLYVRVNGLLKRNLFKKRLQAKPVEYPELLGFKDAIRHTYWVHSEFNYEPDRQDFLVNITEKERKVIERCMLAISQVEVTVKRFWADLYSFIPKPEVDMVGVTFAESEARHFDAYSNLLELLGLNEAFDGITEIPALMKRISYMEDFQASKKLGEQGFSKSLVLFSLFVEHISLFGQFYTMLSFNKRKNMFKGLSNAIEATSKEEELHGQFGIALYQIMRNEHPEFFDDVFMQELQELADIAYETEMEILDWIFEDGDLDFLTKFEVQNFIASRYNKSLETLGLEPKHLVDSSALATTKWFDEEILVTKEEDFFNKRSVAYNKKDKSFDDIF